MRPKLSTAREKHPVLAYFPAQANDFKRLLGLRVAAMRDSLEAIGRFDLERARTRLAATFKPENTWWILDPSYPPGEDRIGFYALQTEVDHLMLQHLYLEPARSGRGLGALVMLRLIDLSRRAALPLRVCALRESRSNGFYASHGFIQTGEGEWDIEYERPVNVEAHFSTPAT